MNDRSNLSAHEVTAEGRIESDRRAGNLLQGRTTIAHFRRRPCGCGAMLFVKSGVLRLYLRGETAARAPEGHC